MGDDHTCQMVCKGTVRIRMYDGTFRELKGIRYISNITKNIISVGALEAEGLRGLLEKAFSRCLVARWLF